jgi:hypothetical protein
MSSVTSFVAVEVRQDVAADLPAAELRRIPVALLEDWHGSEFMDQARAMPMHGYAEVHADLLGRACYAMAPPMSAPDDSMMARDFEEASEMPGSAAFGVFSILVSTQRADGSWAWSTEVLEYLGLGRADCEPVFEVLGLDAATADLAGPTLLALGILARDFADFEDQWGPLADKALEWLAGQGVTGQGVTAPRAPHALDQWMAAWLRTVRPEQSA